MSDILLNCRSLSHFGWAGAGSSGVGFSNSHKGGRMGLRMRVHDKEPIGQAMRRFKKLIERSGMQKELRAHQYYEKPCEQRRRAQLRKEKAARKAQRATY